MCVFVCVRACGAKQLLCLCTQPEPHVYTEFTLPLSEMTRTADKDSGPAWLAAPPHTRVGSTGGLTEGNYSRAYLRYTGTTFLKKYFKLRGKKEAPRPGKPGRLLSAGRSFVSFPVGICIPSIVLEGNLSSL